MHFYLFFLAQEFAVGIIYQIKDSTISSDANKNRDFLSSLLKNV